MCSNDRRIICLLSPQLVISPFSVAHTTLIRYLLIISLLIRSLIYCHLIILNESAVCKILAVTVIVLLLQTSYEQIGLTNKPQSISILALPIYLFDFVELENDINIWERIIFEI